MYLFCVLQNMYPYLVMNGALWYTPLKAYL